MRLQWLELRDFRSHRDSRIDLSGESALVLGANGSGKTNLIEAIVLLSIGRSFRGARDRDMTRRGAAAFQVRAGVADGAGAGTGLEVRGSMRGGREVSLNGEPLARLTDLLGRFPTVHFSVDDVTALGGAPVARRRFLDVALCQLEPAYVGALRDYVAALRQRNRLLVTRADASGSGEFDAWEEILARAGLELDLRRADLAEALTRHLGALGEQVDPALQPAMRYPAPGEPDGP